MKFTVQDIDDSNFNLGIRLTISAENSLPETLAIMTRFRRDEFDLTTQSGALVYASCIGNPNYQLTLESEKRPWFELESALELEWTMPYSDRIEKLTGWTHPTLIPDLDLTGAFKRLGVYCLVDEAHSENGHICFKAYDQGFASHGDKIMDRTQKGILMHIQDEVGFGGVEPEHIIGDKGREITNPRRGQKIKPTPKLANAYIYNAIWNWHEEHTATPEQKRYLKLGRELSDIVDFVARQGYGSLNFFDCGGFKYLSKDSDATPYNANGGFKTMKWEDFQKL